MISASQQESQVMTTTQNVWRVQKIPKCQRMVNQWGIHQKNFTMEVHGSINFTKSLEGSKDTPIKACHFHGEIR